MDLDDNDIGPLGPLSSLKTHLFLYLHLLVQETWLQTNPRVQGAKYSKKEAGAELCTLIDNKDIERLPFSTQTTTPRRMPPLGLILQSKQCVIEQPGTSQLVHLDI